MSGHGVLLRCQLRYAIPSALPPSRRHEPSDRVRCQPSTFDARTALVTPPTTPIIPFDFDSAIRSRERSKTLLAQSHALNSEGWCMQNLYACPAQSQCRDGSCRSDCSVTYISAVLCTRRDLLARIDLINVSSLSNPFKRARDRSMAPTHVFPQVSAASPFHRTSSSESAKSTPHACAASRLAKQSTWLSAHLHPTLALPCLWAVIGCDEAGRFFARGTCILLHRLQRCESGW